MAHRFGKDTRLVDDQAQELLEELEISQRAVVDSAREMSSIRVHASVVVRAANVCDRDTVLGTGHATEVARHGVACIVDRPPAVGSVFHLGFDRQQLDLEPVIAVCERCAMLGDEAFEVRFQFLGEIEFPPRLPDSRDK